MEEESFINSSAKSGFDDEGEEAHGIFEPAATMNGSPDNDSIDHQRGLDESGEMNHNRYQHRNNSDAVDTAENDIDEYSQGSEGSDDESDQWRVKVYFLEKDGTWADIGTGYATCRQSAEGSFILVYDERDERNIIHRSKILSSECYERQGESIIMWKEISEENDKEYDVALSFQNPAGCLSAWNLIGTLSQPTYAYQYGNHALRLLGENDEMLMNVSKYARIGIGSPTGRRDVGNIPLPDCTAANLVEIRNLLNNSNGMYNNVHMERFLANEAEYFKKLLLVFNDLEDLEDIVGLRVIADIMRFVLLFNDAGLLDFILSDEIFVQVLGVMEYDQCLREQANYREFITGKANLIEVFPLKEELRKEIKKYFHVKFLKEIVIRPLLDENGISSINSSLTFSAISICDEMFIDKEYMGKILTEILKLKNTAKTKGGIQENGDAIIADDIKHKDSDANGNSSYSDSSSSDPVRITDENNHNGKNELHVQMNISGSSSNECERMNDRPYLSLLFLRELFFLSRTVPMDRRYEMYMNFCEHSKTEFFDAMHNMLLIPPDISTGMPSSSGAPKRSERSLSVEILSTLASVVPAVVRSLVLEGPTPLPPPNVVSQGQRGNFSASSLYNKTDSETQDSNSKCLLFVIIRLVGACNSVSDIELLTDILRCLLDAERTEKLEKDKFLQLFYDYYVHWLLVPFNVHSRSLSSSSSQSSNSGKENTNGNAYSPVAVPSWVGESANINSTITSARCLCELLCACAQGHSYRMKYFVMRNNVIGRVFSLLGTGRHQLYLGAIKFLRAILYTKDEFYYRHIQKIDLMRLMFEALGEFGSRDNLIVSSILEIVEFVRNENIKILIEYIVEKYSSKLQSMDHVETYDKLLIRYEQIKDGESNGHGEMDFHTASGDVGGRSNMSNTLAQIRNKYLAERDSEDDYFQDEGNDSESDYNSSIEIVVDEIEDSSGGKNGRDFETKRSHEAHVSHPSGNTADPLSALSSIYGDDDDENSPLKGDQQVATTGDDSYKYHPSEDGSALKKSKILPDEQIDIFHSLPPIAAKVEHEEPDVFSSSGIVKKNIQKKTIGFQINIKPN